MWTSWRKREAAGIMWAKEEATEEDVETEPTLDVEGVGRLEQGAEEEKGAKGPEKNEEADAAEEEKGVEEIEQQGDAPDQSVSQLIVLPI